MPSTIRDVALKAGVSPATVSKAMNGSGSVSEETQKKINNELAADKAQINGEMQYVRKAKRKYEVLCVIMLIAIVVYIAIFDLPNPSNGITYLLSNLLGK